MDLIDKYFPSITVRQRRQFIDMLPLYSDWNQKINVISRKDFDAFYEHHVLHSLAIAKVISFAPDSKVMDLSTGGGFPGLPLAIMFPDVNFLLVDSVGKKLTVVQDIASQLGLDNIKTVHDRAENVEGLFEFVISRAVTRLNEAWAWTHDKINLANRNSLHNGMLYLKGGDITAELPSDVKVSRWELSDFYDELYFDEKALVHIYR